MKDGRATMRAVRMSNDWIFPTYSLSFAASLPLANSNKANLSDHDGAHAPWWMDQARSKNLRVAHGHHS